MKKVITYITICAIGAMMCLESCSGRVWDTNYEFIERTWDWYNEYVGYACDQAVHNVVDTLKSYSEYTSDKMTVIQSELNDTLFKEIQFKTFHREKYGDSVNVTSTLLQIGDSIIIRTDGYRYSEKYWAHLFTVDPGMINSEGIFHIDYYEIGKTSPFSWSEIDLREGAHSSTGFFVNYGWY